MHSTEPEPSDDILNLLGLRVATMFQSGIFCRSFINKITVRGISLSQTALTEAIIDNGRPGVANTIAFLIYPENRNDPHTKRSRLRAGGSLYRCEITVLPKANARKCAVSIASHFKARGLRITNPPKRWPITIVKSHKVIQDIKEKQDKQHILKQMAELEKLLSIAYEYLTKINAIHIRTEQGLIQPKQADIDLDTQYELLQRLYNTICEKYEVLKNLL